LIPASISPLPNIDSVIAAFDTYSLEGKKAEVREMKKLNQEWQQFNFCPLRLTGSSPTLFVYGRKRQEYKISIDQAITYSYPEAVNNSWTTKVSYDGLEIGSTKVHSIYYEYKPLKFDKPATGWRVSKKGLAAFANKVGSRLGLTSAETERLAFELNLAAYKVESEELFVGPIPQTEVDEKVALEVSPQVPVVRYHFYVDQASGKVTAPSLTPITRSASMVVEVGAFSPASL